MMNRINLQLVAMGRQMTKGQFLILLLNGATFLTLILGSSNFLFALMIFTSLMLLNGHFIVYASTVRASYLQRLDLWLIGLTLVAGYFKLMAGM
ncbi:hypothetical protein FD04_GL001801 [Secundilactobacillus odoratitofui DSM 19909 = JCM 15043]|uniref:Uncharacterized protein n=1 Tax=Secundilactobacillus odoratitofui DSM 19909 = JCM 15043 TaxID=1423776 RepID=A0A0R1LVH6_9LACO|nr:hypothetical protein [Secundilactobacillus odoratitofui]KRK96945.1 hypothetical protein FD04_GL001801 [Secundilactobacillus odoratitofui DSM 19909 = JCM 15043]